MKRLHFTFITMCFLPVVCFFVYACSRLNEELPLASEEVNKETEGWKTGYYRGQLIEYEVINGRNIYQGDIIISEDEIADTQHTSLSKQGVGWPIGDEYLWPNSTVYYVVNGNVTATQKDLLNKAIEYYHTNTCIRFINQVNPNGGSINVYNNGNNISSAEVGYRPHRNVLMGLQDGRINAIAVIHELGHILGLHHEQCRPDRDNYINIHAQNVKNGYLGNFTIPSGYATYGPFDFDSFMMYGSYSHSNGNGPTMTKKDGSTFSNPKGTFSDIDRETIATMYPCELQEVIIALDASEIPPGIAQFSMDNGVSWENITNITGITVKYPKGSTITFLAKVTNGYTHGYTFDGWRYMKQIVTKGEVFTVTLIPQLPITVIQAGWREIDFNIEIYNNHNIEHQVDIISSDGTVIFDKNIVSLGKTISRHVKFSQFPITLQSYHKNANSYILDASRKYEVRGNISTNIFFQ